jgi:hypothetical protein
MKDLQFTYKYNIRHVLINKLGYIKNEINIPFIKKLIFLINIRNIENVDERQIYNYFYLFKFFLGRKTYITKNKKVYHLGKWYYSFNIQIIINNKDIYSLLYYLYNNIINEIDKSLIKYLIINKKIENKYIVFSLINEDNSIYNEYKTNYGLFNLKSPIKLYLYMVGLNENSKKILIENILKKKW